MARYQTLKTALKLLSTRSPEAVETEKFRVASLSSQGRRRLNEQLESTHAWRLGDQQNVVGLGIADKHAGSGSTGELALSVYVKKKRQSSSLNQSQIVPQELSLEGLDEPVLTDVREIGEVRLESLTTMKRPTICGYSIGRTEEGVTGTLGCIVTRRGTGDLLLLSNNHIFANSGAAQPGDPIYQPALDDVEQASEPSEPVARLVAWQPFKYGDSFDNYVDAALAEPVDPKLCDPTIYDIGRSKGVRIAERGMMVQKSGRTSEHTWGKVEDIDFTTKVPYPRLNGEGFAKVTFSDLILCTRFTEHGDSGSLVLDAEEYAVGLHFCGTSSTSISNKIQNVLDALNVDLVT